MKKILFVFCLIIINAQHAFSTSLNDALSLAYKNNKELKIMSSKIKGQEFELKNKLSAWYPSINLSGDGIPQYKDGKNYNDILSSDVLDVWRIFGEVAYRIWCRPRQAWRRAHIRTAWNHTAHDE